MSNTNKISAIYEIQYKYKKNWGITSEVEVDYITLTVEDEINYTEIYNYLIRKHQLTRGNPNTFKNSVKTSVNLLKVPTIVTKKPQLEP